MICRKSVGWVLVLVAAAISGCSSNGVKKAEQYVAQENWLRAVMAYRDELSRDPSNVKIISELKQAELHAAEHYYDIGMMHLSRRQYSDAVGSFEQGLAAMPKNEKLQDSMRTALAMSESEQLVKEALRYKQIGDIEKEGVALKKAMELTPSDTTLIGYWESYLKRSKPKPTDGFEAKLGETITLNFNETPIKKAFNFLSTTFGINVIFDDEVKERNVNLLASRVTLSKALDLMVSTTQTFYKKVAGNTILIAPDTKDKRGQYEDYIIQTFPLNNASAKQMADLLKGVLSLQKVVVNEDLNTLTIRATRNDLELVSELIRANDRKPAEIILEVEILEVSRKKALQLGFDYGSVFTLEFPQHPVTEPLSSTLEQGVLTLPAVTFRYFKQNVDADTLANPKVRVIDGKKANIHIGDRVPLRSSTIQDATGQTRTTFEYTDIGIRLEVEPQIQLDNSSLVTLSLEVSSLGQNLGTQAEPAYSIGTRNAETQMLLRDGETAILGGLIRDEDRSTTVKVPGLGDIPGLGYLFSSLDDSTDRTDVLLTITPRLIRPWDLPTTDSRVLYSGTAERYFTQSRMTDKTDSMSNFSATASALAHHTPPVKTVLKLDKPRYTVSDDETFEVGLITLEDDSSASYPVQIKYDSEMIEFVGLSSPQAQSINDVTQEAEGVLNARVSFAEVAAQGSTETLEKFVFRAKEKGAGYLLLSGSSRDSVTKEYSTFGSDSSYVHIE